MSPPLSLLAPYPAPTSESGLNGDPREPLPRHTPEDAEIVESARQLLRKRRVDPKAADSLRSRFGDEGFIELTGAIGYYSMLAMAVNACELEVAPGAEILRV